MDGVVIFCDFHSPSLPSAPQKVMRCDLGANRGAVMGWAFRCTVVSLRPLNGYAPLEPRSGSQEGVEVGVIHALVARGIDAYDAIQPVVRFEPIFRGIWDIVDPSRGMAADRPVGGHDNGSSGRPHFDAIRNGCELSSVGVGKLMFSWPALWLLFKLPRTW